MPLNITPIKSILGFDKLCLSVALYHHCSDRPSIYNIQSHKMPFSVASKFVLSIKTFIDHVDSKSFVTDNESSCQ